MPKKLLRVCTLLIISTINLSAIADVHDDANVIDISGGEQHTLVLTKNGYAWGCGPMIGEDTLLVRIADGDMNTASGYLEGIIDIAAGWEHSLVLDANSNVWAWGDNEKGELGVGAGVSSSSIPLKVYNGEMVTDSNFLEHIDTIASGRSGKHSMAIEAFDPNDPNLNGRVYTWGHNNMGQLGNGPQGAGNKSTPVIVHAGDQNETDPGTDLKWITAISGGEEHSMALDVNGYVYTFGDNDDGKLGINETFAQTDHKTTPVMVLSGEQDDSNDNSFLQNIVAISSGWDHCMAVEDINDNDPNANGRVYTWGDNGIGHYGSNGGRLGNGHINDSNSTPVLVHAGEQDPCDPNSPLVNITAISAGESHCMALDVNGNVWTWGDNSHGQLGNGTDGDYKLTAVKVIGRNGQGYLENIAAISAGYWHCLAIDSNGILWTWGHNRYKALSLGNWSTGYENSIANTPHPVGVVKNLTRQEFYFGIQNAIDDANDGDVLEATIGDYYDNVKFYGANSITLKGPDPKNWEVVKKTVIDGLNGKEGKHTVMLDSNSVLSGFTVTGGASGGSNTEGSNISVNGYSPVIYNCIIRDSLGIGIFFNIDANDLTIDNCIIKDNDLFGLHVNNYNAPFTIINSWVYNNSLNADNNGYLYYGGIMYWARNDKGTIRNNTIVNNKGYGIFVFDGDANASNCIVWGNEYDQLYNCSATYSCIENGGTNNYNIEDDPCFVDEPNDDFHLLLSSPCINTGDNNDVNDGEVDIDDEIRIWNGRVDRGADEVISRPDCWSYETQCHGDADGDGNVDTVDWPPFRDGFGKTYPDPLYIANACGDYNRDGTIDTVDWPEFRDNFGGSPPADCNTTCGSWPPDSNNVCVPLGGSGQSAQGGAGESMGMSSSSEASIEDELFEMLYWMSENDMPGWEEFLDRLTE